jgi:hypothetical protein
MRKQISVITMVLGLGALLLSSCTVSQSTPTDTYSAWSLAPDNTYCQFTTKLPEDCDNWYRYLLNVKPTKNDYSYTYTGTVEIETGCMTDGAGLTLFMDSTFSNFFAVVINENRQYTIRQMKNGTWITLQDWTTNTDLISGYKQKNTISVKFITGPAMQVTFNGGTNTTTFWNSDVPISLGYPGFIVYVSPAAAHDFPTTPVLTKYTLTSPFAYP